MLHNFPNFIFIILIFVVNVFGQEENSNLKKLKTPDKQESNIFLSFGPNLSSYLHEKDDWHLGYNIGLTFNIMVHKKISITLPFSYARLNAAPRKVDGRFYSHNNFNIYKEFIDWQVSLAFLEIPICMNYKFFVTNRFNIGFIIGIGLAIAVKDFSNIENVEITDEIIGNHGGAIPLEPQNVLYSTFNIYSGVRIHSGRLYLDLIYILYPSKIKRINKLNVISLRLGIGIH